MTNDLLINDYSNNKKLEKIVKPAVEELIEEYKDILFNTETPLVETDDSFSVKFVNKRQESEFKLTQKSNIIQVYEMTFF